MVAGLQGRACWVEGTECAWLGDDSAGCECGCSVERGEERCAEVGCKGLSSRVGGHLRSSGFILNERGATEEGTHLALESSWLHLGE